MSAPTRSVPPVTGTHGTPRSAVPRPTTGRSQLLLRLSSEDRERAQYWADKRGFASLSEYVVEAVAEQVRRENLDFDIPSILTARINQVVDELRALSTNVANLERVSTQGFDSLIGLTRGDNYLLDDEDGELP